MQQNKVLELILQAEQNCMDKYRSTDGYVMQNELEKLGFLKVRDLKLQYRKFYNKGIVSYCQTHFENEVVKCGYGGNYHKAIMIHPETISKAILKLSKED